MKLMALPCQNCLRDIDKFNISLSDPGSITLRLQCHDCRTTTYVHLAFETLNCIARGEPVMITPNDPAIVM
jgi:hypothetical protein